MTVWSKWIYSSIIVSNVKQCGLNCFYDANCDFFVYHKPNCFFGNFSYNNDEHHPVTTSIASETVNFKKLGLL
jgi:hypothetical protein